MPAIFMDDSSRTLGAALHHTASLVREKVWEISLLRDLGECVLHVNDRKALSAAICGVLQGALQLDACALYLREGARREWGCVGHAAPEGRAGDIPAPRSIGPDLSSLLERCLSRGAVASGTAEGTVRVAIPLRRDAAGNGGSVAGALVLIGEEVAGLLETRREVLAIVANQTAMLLSVAAMFARPDRKLRSKGDVSAVTSRSEKDSSSSRRKSGLKGGTVKSPS
ncbi:MAG: hypothetical protein OEW11_07360 [Nitrospirota bacterium]|nr:hypothetical protein [Nitrospirota bacterium]